MVPDHKFSLRPRNHVSLIVHMANMAEYSSTIYVRVGSLDLNSLDLHPRSVDISVKPEIPEAIVKDQRM